MCLSVPKLLNDKFEAACQYFLRDKLLIRGFICFNDHFLGLGNHIDKLIFNFAQDLSILWQLRNFDFLFLLRLFYLLLLVDFFIISPTSLL